MLVLRLVLVLRLLRVALRRHGRALRGRTGPPVAAVRTPVAAERTPVAAERIVRRLGGRRGTVLEGRGRGWDHKLRGLRRRRRRSVRRVGWFRCRLFTVRGVGGVLSPVGCVLCGGGFLIRRRGGRVFRRRGVPRSLWSVAASVLESRCRRRALEPDARLRLRHLRLQHIGHERGRLSGRG